MVCCWGCCWGIVNPQQSTDSASSGAGPSALPGGDGDVAVWRHQHSLGETLRSTQGALVNCHCEL